MKVPCVVGLVLVAAHSIAFAHTVESVNVEATAPQDKVAKVGEVTVDVPVRVQVNADASAAVEVPRDPTFTAKKKGFEIPDLHLQHDFGGYLSANYPQIVSVGLGAFLGLYHTSNEIEGYWGEGQIKITQGVVGLLEAEPGITAGKLSIGVGYEQYETEGPSCLPQLVSEKYFFQVALKAAAMKMWWTPDFAENLLPAGTLVGLEGQVMYDHLRITIGVYKSLDDERIYYSAGVGGASSIDAIKRKILGNRLRRF